MEIPKMQTHTPPPLPASQPHWSTQQCLCRHPHKHNSSTIQIISVDCLICSSSLADALDFHCGNLYTTSLSLFTEKSVFMHPSNISVDLKSNVHTHTIGLLTQLQAQTLGLSRCWSSLWLVQLSSSLATYLHMHSRARVTQKIVSNGI